MIHIRNSKPNSIFLLEHEGVPSGTLTDFNETIIDGSLCIDVINQNMYILKSGTWTLVSIGNNNSTAGNGLSMVGNKTVLGGALSQNTTINSNPSSYIFQLGDTTSLTNSYFSLGNNNIKLGLSPFFGNVNTVEFTSTGSKMSYTNNIIGGAVEFNLTGSGSQFKIKAGLNAGNYFAILNTVALTSDKNFGFPNQTGTLALTSDINGKYLSLSGGTMGGVLKLADGAQFQSGFLFADNGNPSVFYNSRQLVDTNGGAILDWNDKSVGVGISTNSRWAFLKTDNITSTDKTYQFPDSSGTLALVGQPITTPISFVTQTTSKTTTVNVDSVAGNITTVALTDAAGTFFDFTLTGAHITGSSIVILTPVTNGGSGIAYVTIIGGSPTSRTIRVYNIHPTDPFNLALSIHFLIIN